MRLSLLIIITVLAALLASCQGAPPTVIIVVTSTPAETPNAEATAEAQAVADAAEETQETNPNTEEPVDDEPAVTPSPAPSSTPDVFPTTTTSQIQVAEQVFEGGRMFWLQPTRQIWVLEVNDNGDNTWTIYEDTFEEGEPEIDPSIIAPEEGLRQPERGFGKLWRENPEVREALGWAITPEFGYVSAYEYIPGGEVEGGEFQPGPGAHVIFSLYGEKFQFNEDDNTWQLGDG